MQRVAVHGVAGRMGRALVRLLAAADDLVLGGAIARPGSEAVGADAGELAGVGRLGLAVVSDVDLSGVDAVIDFSVPQAAMDMVAACQASGTALVSGTTGLSAVHLESLSRAASVVPIVFAPNMSVGVNLTFKLVELAARALGDDVDVEVIEAHHRHKVDAPSGTALRLGEILADALGRDLSSAAVYGRQGETGPRQPGSIGFSAIRGGDIVGEHTVLFAGAGERLELTHRAQSRDNFAEGALRAVRFLEGRGPGLFDMQDVLGLRGALR